MYASSEADTQTATAQLGIHASELCTEGKIRWRCSRILDGCTIKEQCVHLSLCVHRVLQLLSLCTTLFLSKTTHDTPTEQRSEQLQRPTAPHSNHPWP